MEVTCVWSLCMMCREVKTVNFSSPIMKDGQEPWYKEAWHEISIWQEEAPSHKTVKEDMKTCHHEEMIQKWCINSHWIIWHSTMYEEAWQWKFILESPPKLKCGRKGALSLFMEKWKHQHNPSGAKHRYTIGNRGNDRKRRMWDRQRKWPVWSAGSRATGYASSGRCAIAWLTVCTATGRW